MLNIQITDTLWVSPDAVLAAHVTWYEDSPYSVVVTLLGAAPVTPYLWRGGTDGWPTEREALAVLHTFRAEVARAQRPTWRRVAERILFGRR